MESFDLAEIKIGYGIFVASVILMSFLLFACVSAEDLNATDMALNQEDSPDLELAKENVEYDSNDSAYLILDNDADIEHVNVGDEVVWTVSVINKGPGTAKSVKVHDILPDGMKYVRHHATKGTFNPETGIWDIGDLTIDDGMAILDITTLALSAGEKINRAWVVTDSVNLNNESFEEEEIDVFEPQKSSSESYTIPKAEAATGIYPTGNPIALALLSLLMIAASCQKRKNSCIHFQHLFRYYH